MLFVLLTAALLVALTVTVHSIGLAVLIRKIDAGGGGQWGFWSMAGFLVRVTWWLLLIHGVEIAIWALFYKWAGCMPDLESAFYFSGVTYTTVGYGDLVLPSHWRMLGPIEGVTGILMCGLSTGLFFALVSRLYRARADAGATIDH